MIEVKNKEIVKCSFCGKKEEVGNGALFVLTAFHGK